MESVFKVKEASKEVGRVIRVHRYSPLSFQGVYRHISHLDYNLQLLKLSDFEQSHETPVPTLKIFICSYFFLDFLWTLDIKKGWIKFFKLTQIQGRFVKCHHNFICFVIFDYLILRHS